MNLEEFGIIRDIARSEIENNRKNRGLKPIMKYVFDIYWNTSSGVFKDHDILKKSGYLDKLSLVVALALQQNFRKGI